MKKKSIISLNQGNIKLIFDLLRMLLQDFYFTNDIIR